MDCFIKFGFGVMGCCIANQGIAGEQVDQTLLDKCQQQSRACDITVVYDEGVISEGVAEMLRAFPKFLCGIQVNQSEIGTNVRALTGDIENFEEDLSEDPLPQE
jgi:hypothetical protein